MNASLLLLDRRSKALKHEATKRLRRHLGQPPCFIDAPVLDGEIGDAEKLAGLLLNLAGQAVCGDRNGHSRLVACNPATTEILSDGSSGATADEEVCDKITFSYWRLG